MHGYKKVPGERNGGWGGVMVLKERAPLGHLLLGRLGLSCLGPVASWNTPSTLSPQPLQLHVFADLGGRVLAQLHDARCAGSAGHRLLEASSPPQEPGPTAPGAGGWE